MKPTYATVERLREAADYKPTAYETDRLARIVDAASRHVELRLHRHFYPLTETVTYTRPPFIRPTTSTSTGFWLNRDLLSVSAVTVDDVAATVADIELWPTAHGPYYSWIGVTGSDIDVAGDWGYDTNTATAGALNGAMADTTGTAATITDSSLVGIGDLIIADTERMVVTAKLQVDTTQDLQTDLTADTSNTTVAVTDGTAYNASESLLLDAEEMLILFISANNLTVRRAWNGSVLAAHSGSDIYAPRTLTVERGAAGSTAATHADAAAVTRNLPPAAITKLCIAEAINTYEQETSGYARQVGSGETLREARGVGLEDARKEAVGYLRTRAGVV